jgi:hypothetical protein
VNNFLRLDDILAALILSLVMMRRIEVKTTQASTIPMFHRKSSLTGARARCAHRLGGLVVVGQDRRQRRLVRRCRAARASARPGFSWAVLLFLGWLLSLVWAWRAATDGPAAAAARYQLRRACAQAGPIAARLRSLST